MPVPLAERLLDSHTLGGSRRQQNQEAEPAAKRKNVEAHVAEGMTLRELRQARKLMQVRTGRIRGSRWTMLRVWRSGATFSAVHAPEYRRAMGANLPLVAQFPRPRAGCPIPYCRRRSGSKVHKLKTCTPFQCDSNRLIIGQDQSGGRKLFAE